MSKSFHFESLVSLCGQTHEAMRLQAARSVNIGLVVRNWLFGWYIVEYQQNGADRAEYGERFIDTLAEKLKEQGIKGGSPTRLRLYRGFYQQYEKIRPTLSVEFDKQLDENHLEIQRKKVGFARKIGKTIMIINPGRIAPALDGQRVVQRYQFVDASVRVNRDWRATLRRSP